jgi:hypothetical protein
MHRSKERFPSVDPLRELEILDQPLDHRGILDLEI